MRRLNATKRRGRPPLKNTRRCERTHLKPGTGEAWRFSALNKDSSALAPPLQGLDRYCTVNCTVLLRDAVPDVAFTVIV
jgi:hypothetical protein